MVNVSFMYKWKKFDDENVWINMYNNNWCEKLWMNN